MCVVLKLKCLKSAGHENVIAEEATFILFLLCFYFMFCCFICSLMDTFLIISMTYLIRFFTLYAKADSSSDIIDLKTSEQHFIKMFINLSLRDVCLPNQHCRKVHFWMEKTLFLFGSTNLKDR